MCKKYKGIVFNQKIAILSNNMSEIDDKNSACTGVDSNITTVLDSCSTIEVDILTTNNTTGVNVAM